MPAELPAGLPVARGEIVDGKYRIDAFIGAGGMGCVVEAMHLQLLQRVALKFVLADSDDADSATRLVREARAAVALRSDHVARVMDVGTLPNGLPYLVMELLDGRTLSQTLASNGALGIEQARTIAIETCRALAEAHRRGIVHRDVKPANIFLATREDGPPRVKVLDFGIAKVADPRMAVESQLTSTEHALGTPRYMAPEQLSAARDVDARADVWAVGIVLFECLTGSAPFSRGTAYEVGARILSEAVPRVSKRRPDVPADLDAIVARCLERDAAARFADASELLAALEGRAPSAGSIGASPATNVGLGFLKATQKLPDLAPTRAVAARSPAVAASHALPSPANAANGANPANAAAANAANEPRATGGAMPFVVGTVLLLGVLAVFAALYARRPSTPSVTTAPATTAGASAEVVDLPTSPPPPPLSAEPSAATATATASLTVNPSAPPPKRAVSNKSPMNRPPNER